MTLPDDIEPGPHRIILRGLDPEGNTLERIAYIYVGDDGRLLAKSFRGPISEADLLAETGFSGYDPAMLGGFAVIAMLGGAVLVVRRGMRAYFQNLKETALGQKLYPFRIHDHADARDCGLAHSVQSGEVIQGNFAKVRDFVEFCINEGPTSRSAETNRPPLTVEILVL